MWGWWEPPAKLGVNLSEVGPEIRGVNHPGIGGTVLRSFGAPVLHGPDIEPEKVEAAICLASLRDLTTEVFDDGVYPYACIFGAHLLSLCLHMEC